MCSPAPTQRVPVVVEPEPQPNADADAAEHSSPPPSSPSNIASVRVQKRRREVAAAEEAKSTVGQPQFVDFNAHKRQRRSVALPSRKFEYSPLPPSSPIRTERSSSEPRSPLPQAPRLSPVAEAEASEVPVASDSAHGSDPSGQPNDNNAENIRPAGWIPGFSPKPGPSVDKSFDHSPRSPLWYMMRPGCAPEIKQAYWERYWPVCIPQPSSLVDIKMAWPSEPNQGEGSKDSNAAAGAETTEQQAEEEQAGPGPQAESGFGESVSAAIVRAKNKRKEQEAVPVSPGAGPQLQWKQHSRQEEDLLWGGPWQSHLIS